MNFSAIRAGVYGATGYTGRELLRLLAAHPAVRLGFATSQSEAGSRLRTGARRTPEVALTRAEAADPATCDVVFSCLPHGESVAWVERARKGGARVVDLSSDLRVPAEGAAEWARESVYGLPELHRERIAGARLVANPGCYPTAALLALRPLVRRGLVGGGPVVINAASGVTGAGRSPKRELLFGEVAEDFRAYAVGNGHRHLAELRDQVGRMNGRGPELVFTPHLLPIRRGILETIYVPLKEEIADPVRLWVEDYAEEPFVQVLESGSPTIAEVVGTNRVVIGVSGVAAVSAPLLIVTAAIDNLLKGAAGQAVQNMNLMFGVPETEGLPC